MIVTGGRATNTREVSAIRELPAVVVIAQLTGVAEAGVQATGRTTMLRADELTVVHHDDSVSLFTDVRYTLGRAGLHVVLATGEEIRFASHEVLTTRADSAARTDEKTAYAIAA
jgi:hypothetical protein